MLSVACCQHVGQAGFNQQDALLLGHEVWQARDLSVERAFKASGMLLAVADGVSASPAAERASRLVLDLLQEKLASAPEAEPISLDGRLVRAIQQEMAHRLRHRRSHGAACTLAAVQWQAEKLVMLNCGDSRVLHIHRPLATGNEWAWRQLSKDHSLRQQFIDQGLADDAADYASLYDGLANCLIADSEETDFELHRQEARISPGDYVLLMTDGVHDVLPLAALQASFDPRLGVRQQVERWRVAVLAAGSPDNFSLILARRD